jgi:photosystem II stability/assembly factor-like uncharacterized protein
VEAGSSCHTENGHDWVTNQLNTDSLHALFFLGAHGWAAGNGFFHTTDGGGTWTKDNNWGSIYDLFFIDAQRGWACGNGGVTYRTTNGGLTWAFQAVGTMTTPLLHLVRGRTGGLDRRHRRAHLPQHQRGRQLGAPVPVWRLPLDGPVPRC